MLKGVIALYINQIKNHREFTIEMLEDISTLSDEHKMLLIIEYNISNKKPVIPVKI
jgi:hypothetical protein